MRVECTGEDVLSATDSVCACTNVTFFNGRSPAHVLLLSVDCRSYKKNNISPKNGVDLQVDAGRPAGGSASVDQSVYCWRQGRGRGGPCRCRHRWDAVATVTPTRNSCCSWRCRWWRRRWQAAGDCVARPDTHDAYARANCASRLGRDCTRYTADSLLPMPENKRSRRSNNGRVNGMPTFHVVFVFI